MSVVIPVDGKVKVFPKPRLIRESARIVVCARSSHGRECMSLKVDIFWKMPVNMFVMPNVSNKISISL